MRQILFKIIRLVESVVLWLRGETLKLLIFALILLLIWGIVAPVGTLAWWLGESAEDLGFNNNLTSDLFAAQPTNVISTTSAPISCYIIFLPGVGDFSANELTPGEEYFLNQLVQVHSECVVVSSVFPYSAANISLSEKRWLTPLWRAAEEADGWFKSAKVLIYIRNLWRFAISADDRYGSVYNLGIATAITERMNVNYPIAQAQKPLKLILIGTSGGAQVALGAVPYLTRWLNTEPIVISVGGSFDGETGFEKVDRVYHVQGDRDWVDDITRFVFVSRWPWKVTSPFNQARLHNRYTIVNSGPHTHDGEQGYFGTAPVKNTDKTYVDLTLRTINQLPIWNSTLNH